MSNYFIAPRLWIDGFDISKHCRSLEIKAEAGAVVTAVIVMNLPQTHITKDGIYIGDLPPNVPSDVTRAIHVPEGD